ncbi:thioredoxin family protein [Chitinophagaceae bacterium LB-8]|jgi:redoxin|uniref:Thioredoxin family protein n=1 Tax=Paraflavisolibacter caeni TaxID=2982496 RepID=A0A9X2XV17_9BACT|nr:thioredoxin family protein [Paraflavisolibacter caeni]MCU7549061.1 thioredoxin family protein [Paraflavisolibacter caeni]
MKPLVLTFLLMPVIWAFTSTKPIPIGSEIPMGDVAIKDISGNEITLNNMIKVNGLLIMFSSNTCPYVKRNEERIEAISNYSFKNQVGFVMINSNEGERKGEESFFFMQKHAREKSWNWYYALDENAVIANAFGAEKTPECFLFDKNGKLVYHGSINDNPGNSTAVTREHLIIAMEEMLEGKDITVKETRSVGCRIKTMNDDLALRNE